VTTNLYTAVGSLQDVYYPNGVQAHYDYDALNRLTNVLHTGSGNVLLSQSAYRLHTNGWRLGGDGDSAAGQRVGCDQPVELGFGMSTNSSSSTAGEKSRSLK
jgi:hypothetical protein